MTGPEDIQYAIENTEVLLEPDRRIDTFGNTRFEFLLLTEPMDSVGQCILRKGEVEADQPRIIRPEGMVDGVEFDGFGDQAKEFFDKLKSAGHDLAMVKYGFCFRRTKISEELLNEPIDQVAEQVMETARREGNPLQAIIKGVDDAWEACILRFTLELTQSSHSTNEFDFRRRGLL